MLDPLIITRRPPEDSLDVPADSTNSPPVRVPDPTVTYTDPPLPAFAPPDPMYNAPLAPLVDVPELNTNIPDPAVEAPAFAV